jgi:hypothetical protein
MTSDEFVASIAVHVRAAAVDDVMGILGTPPGRRPDKALAELSQWYLALSARDREFVKRVIALASHHATFGMLVVLDGDRAIEGVGEHERLELRHVSSATTTLLNDPREEPLHHRLPPV